jgi:hypothetical protein
MFGPSRTLIELTKRLKDVTTLLMKVLAGNSVTHSRIAALEATLARDRDSDRRFVMSLVTLLRAPGVQQAVPLSPPSLDDLFAEVPVGSPEGYTLEELGIDDSSEATE